MKIMDADGDGVITESELDQLKVPKIPLSHGRAGEGMARR